MELIIDPEFKALIRRLSHEEYRGLEESILEEGCRDSLTVWGNTLVDGHHRYEICTVHDIPFNTVQREFASRSDAKIWIAKNQFAKRNLSNWDRCTLALELEDAFKEKAKENISAAVTRSNIERNSLNPSLTNLSKLDLDSGFNTRAKVAKIADVSEGTIEKAKVIIEKGTPEQIARLENRKASISAIYNEIKEKEKQEKVQAEEAEPQKEFSVSTETPALDQANKDDAAEQTQQQSEPGKEPTNVQVATEPGEPTEPHEPSKPSEPGEPSIESDSGKGLESGQEQQQGHEEEREPEKEQEQHQEHEEIAEKEPREETEKEPEEKQEPEEEPEQEEVQVKAELEQPIEEDKPVKEGEYPPDCYFYCLGCYKSFKIGDNTKCPLCGSEKIVENDLLNKCDYKPKPLKKKLLFCPGGCGFGIDPVNKKWYSKEETS